MQTCFPSIPEKILKYLLYIPVFFDPKKFSLKSKLERFYANLFCFLSLKKTPHSFSIVPIFSGVKKPTWTLNSSVFCLDMF